MQAITSDQVEARFLEAVSSGHADQSGTSALQVMCKAAFVCASRHGRCAVAMAKADSIEFAGLIGIGAIIDVRASIIFQGRSSMTVAVEIVTQNPVVRTGTPSIRGRFLMVAVNADGVPMPIPPHEDQPTTGETVS